MPTLSPRTRNCVHLTLGFLAYYSLKPALYIQEAYVVGRIVWNCGTGIAKPKPTVTTLPRPDITERAGRELMVQLGEVEKEKWGIGEGNLGAGEWGEKEWDGKGKGGVEGMDATASWWAGEVEVDIDGVVEMYSMGW